MATKTGIEWTDSTWNPIRGCTRVSEGCRNCYAEKVAYRFSGEGQPYAGLAVLKNGHASWTGNVEFVEKHLLDPLKWKAIRLHESKCGKTLLGSQAACTCADKFQSRPRRIFVNSMSDLFHENVTDEMRDKIFAVMALCPQHTFQVLTKRPERMLAYLAAPGRQSDVRLAAGDLAFEVESHKKYPAKMFPANAEVVYDLGAKGDECGCRVSMEWPLPNVWMGVSVENQAAADERIPLLLQTPAAVRFISAEPLLGAVQIPEYLPNSLWNGLASWKQPELDWVICGGESGSGSRPMHPDWARSLRDQCSAAGVPFFFKQWGEWTPGENVERASGVVRGAHWFDGDWSFGPEDLAYNEGHRDDEPDLYLVGKHAAGSLLDGREWKQSPGVLAEQAQ